MVRLECTTGGSNKFYEFHTIKTNGRVMVKAIYGAIGQAGNVHIIYDGDSEEEAVNALQKKQNEKQRKGYIIVGGNGVTVQKKTLTG